MIKYLALLVFFSYSGITLSSEEDTLRELQELDKSQIEFDFYQEEQSLTPSDEQNLIEALELLENSIDSASTVDGASEDMIDPIEELTLDQENIDSQLLETIEDETESTIEQGLEEEIFEILEEEFEEPDEIFNDDFIDNEFGEFNDEQ